tara:strand:+ start:268 stop:516 length:249 start_codon:yes stop_codon:yes gene_type:complete
MKNNDDLQKEIAKLREQIKKTKVEKKKLDQANEKLQDEVDSLWAMMDEMTKSDIQNWSSILEKLEKDTVIKALMVTKNKAEA